MSEAIFYTGYVMSFVGYCLFFGVLYFWIIVFFIVLLIHFLYKLELKKKSLARRKGND